MLAILGGALALVIGLAVLLLPLLLPELSRARDAVWGAVVLLLGLVLVTSAERLRGAPMLGVLCGGLLIGRLSVEVAQARWRQLSEQEQQRLWSPERWQTALRQFSATASQLPALVTQASQGLLAWRHERRQPKGSGKRWVRPEPVAEAAATSPE
ncbi:MAG: Ycf66 family protein, partial [Cyanobium sp.]